MIDGDSVTFLFEPLHTGEVRYLIEFASVKISGVLFLREAVELRTELTKAINQARKEK